MLVTTVLMILLLVGAVVGAARLAGLGGDLVDPYLGGRDADVAHLVMNLGMALMLSALYGPVARTALLVVFTLMAVVIAARLVRGVARPTPRRRAARAGEVYHLVASLAMVYATALMPAMSMSAMGAAPPMAGMSGMDGMGGTSGVEVAAGPPLLAWVLGILFALDVVGTLLIVVLAPDRVVAPAPGMREPTTVPAARSGEAARLPDGPTVPPAAARRAVRVAAVPHVIMGLGMVWMLLTL